jgi:uncharacterized membrane protein
VRGVAGIGPFFWLHGAVLILPFAWLELAAVGLAFLVYARHAADGERISLQDRRLVVELENAGHWSARNSTRDQVRVEPQTGDRSLIEVSGRRVGGQRGALRAAGTAAGAGAEIAWPCASA